MSVARRLRPTSAADRRLLPEGRLAGPMPWVIAVMTFLAGLTLVAGLGLSRLADNLGEGLSRRLTVQIVTADPAARRTQAEAALAALRRLPGVVEAHAVPDAELDRLLAPWLGPSPRTAVPVPAMIDVDLVAADGAGAIGRALARIAPAARIERHDTALAPLRGLVATLRLLGLALLGLMAGAMAAVIMLAARAALDQHRATVEILHLLGAEDGQVARLFARRLSLDALFGAGLGAIAALGATVLLARAVAALDSGLARAARPADMAAIALFLLLPAMVALLAWGAARATVATRLGRAA